MAQLTDAEALRRIYGDPSPRAERKVIDHIDGHCAALIAASPMVFVATAGPAGMDVSPKGDAPGFVAVESPGTLLIPDRPGNSRIDGFLNLIDDPRVGLIFLIPGMRETLRVNGIATLHDDEDLRARFAVKDRLPLTVARIHVEEAFMHCAKAFLRSGLWQPETWPDLATLPRMGEILRDHCSLDETPDEGEMLERLKASLW
jgi:uncharacterized protein